MLLAAAGSRRVPRLRAGSAPRRSCSRESRSLWSSTCRTFPPRRCSHGCSGPRPGRRGESGGARFRSGSCSACSFFWARRSSSRSRCSSRSSGSPARSEGRSGSARWAARRGSRARRAVRRAPDRRDGASGARDVSRGDGISGSGGSRLHALAMAARRARRAVSLRQFLDARRARRLELGGVPARCTPRSTAAPSPSSPSWRFAGIAGAARGSPARCSSSAPCSRSSSASSRKASARRTSWIPLRHPEKFSAAIVLGLAVLAGLAVDRFRSGLRRPAWILWGAAILAAAAVVATKFPARIGAVAASWTGARSRRGSRRRQFRVGGARRSGSALDADLLAHRAAARRAGGARRRRRDPHPRAHRGEPSDREDGPRGERLRVRRHSRGRSRGGIRGARSAPWTRGSTSRLSPLSPCRSAIRTGSSPIDRPGTGRRRRSGIGARCSTSIPTSGISPG